MRGLPGSEEGARFPISMVSSGVWAGKIPLEKAHSLEEVGGGKRTMKQELQRIGYLGATECSFNAMPIAVSCIVHEFNRRKADRKCRHTLNCILVSDCVCFSEYSHNNFSKGCTQSSVALPLHIIS